MARADHKRAASLSYRLSTWAASKCPYAILPPAASAGGFVHYWLSHAKRRGYLDNATPAVRFDRRCPPWRAFQNQALNVLELLRVAARCEYEILGRMTLHGGEHVDRSLEKGHGLILATFHSGNWELAGLMLASRGYPLTTIAGEQLRPGWSDEVKALKVRLGIRVVGHDAGIRTLYDDLHSNRAIVLHIDGDLFTGGYDVPFLGRRVRVARGPAHLSRVLSAPAALAFCRRDRDNRLHVHVEPPLPPPADTQGEVELTRVLMKRIEELILEDPGQWCIFRSLSNTTDRAKP